MDPARVEVPPPEELAFDPRLERVWRSFAEVDVRTAVDDELLFKFLRTAYAAGYHRALGEDDPEAFAREHGLGDVPARR